MAVRGTGVRQRTPVVLAVAQRAPPAGQPLPSAADSVGKCGAQIRCRTEARGVVTGDEAAGALNGATGGVAMRAGLG